MLKNEAFKKYSSNFAFLFGNGGVLNTCSSSVLKRDPSGCLSEEEVGFSKEDAASFV